MAKPLVLLTSNRVTMHTRQFAVAADDAAQIMVPYAATSCGGCWCCGRCIGHFEISCSLRYVAAWQNRRLLPVVQRVMSAADLLTTTLLFAQYTVQPRGALLAAASRYIFAGS